MREGAIAAPGAPLGARTLAFVESVPAWAWLVGLVAVSTGIRFALALPNPGAWIFQDELAYWELGSSLGRNGAFAIRDVPGTGGFGVVYPALISPAAALFESPTDAYTAAKGINALLMSLTAVPVYFLSRRVAGTAPSLLAAVLAVAVPGMVYTAAIMTENAFYPLIACFALALVLMLEKPTVARQLAVFAVIALAFFTRAQGAILIIVVLTAIAIVALIEASAQRFRSRALLRALGAYNVTWLVLLGAAIVVICLQVVRGTSPRELLGAYKGVSDFELPAGAVARWFLYHLADLDLSVGLIPFAAFVVILLIAFRSPRESRPLLVFAATSASLVFWFTLTVSAYATDPGAQRIEERNLFHVVPVLFVALVAWMSRGLPRPLWAIGPAIAAMSALPAAIPYGTLIGPTTAHSTFSLAPLWSLRDDYGVSSRDLRLIVILVAIGAGVLIALLPRRFAAVLPALVLVYFAFVQSPVEGITTKAARDELNAGIQVRSSVQSDSVDRTWVDNRVGRNADVIWVWWTKDVPWALWETEFFNDSIGRVFNLQGPYDGLPQETLSVDSNGVLRDPEGQPVHAQYALAPKFLTLDGDEIPGDDVIGSRLFRLHGPVRLLNQVTGLYLDSWSGPQAEYTRFGCSGGTLTVRLASYAPLHPEPQTVVASIGGNEVARTTLPVGAVDEPFAVPLRSDGDRCTVTFSVAPTMVPAEVLPSTDTRDLGAQFLEFTYEPAEE